MRDSVPSTRYSSVCNVLRQWNIPLIPTYRVYRLCDIYLFQYIRRAVNVLNVSTCSYIHVDKYPPNAIFRNAIINAQRANVTSSMIAQT